jgi:8-oxo-dGTP pyrophosphatase MutT (NUDIX family)
MSLRFRPSVTVAGIVEQRGRFLLVEEQTRDGLRLNNPAGHLDPGESLLQAVVREVLEETACTFIPEALVGVYLSRFSRPADASGPAEEVTYLRFAFCGRVGEPDPARRLDDGIVRTLWLTYDELKASAERHRSPMVLRCAQDLRAGQRFPLDLLHTDPSAFM